MIWVYVLSTSTYCHISINQVSFQSLWYFPRNGPDRHLLLTNLVKGEKLSKHWGKKYDCCALSFLLMCHIFLLFPRYGPDRHSVWKNKSGDNSLNIQGMIMVIVHLPSSHCHPSINHVSFQSLLTFRTGIHYETRKSLEAKNARYIAIVYKRQNL